ncbi:hypothetical protein [Chondromyces apiculatus]|nr:hypothetical protein [Chondromyces apiculatus]
MRRRSLRAAALLAALPALPALTGCVTEGYSLDGVSTFNIEVVRVNGDAPPSFDAPLPANLGNVDEFWDVVIEARDGRGDPTAFEGMVRLRAEPGAVQAVEGEGASGRNLRVRGGRGVGTVRVTGVFGASRMWVEDLGYLPAENLDEAACSNGKNDDPQEDVLVDFPADPGCAYADDDSEEGGTFAAGVSEPVAYALPRISDIQGRASETPYKYEAMEVNTSEPQRLVVIRISSDGFYVTDLAEQGQGYNHLYAFNFSTPPGMRVCDRFEYLAGTVNEFFGGTQIAFPSFRVVPPGKDEPCEVPEPEVIEPAMVSDAVAMEKIESGLVRISGFHITANFGKNRAVESAMFPGVYEFKPDQSNCDLNDDGQVDFESPTEGLCSEQCTSSTECSEWTSYSARGNYKVSNGSTMIQVNTSTVGGFDPTSHRGQVLDVVTGTLRNFSGGSLNWTVETRCSDDLVCQATGCIPAPKPSTEACVRLRTEDDNDDPAN